MTAPMPKPPPRPAPPSNGTAKPMSPVVESNGVKDGPQKIIIFGTGGIGKTELAANMSKIGKVVKIIDLDAGSDNLSVKRVGSFSDWMSLRSYLQDETRWTGVDVVVIDSLTKAEELAIAHTLATVKHEKGHNVTSIEGYGFGKGLQHVYDTFLSILSDLDAHRRSGRDVVVICHECVSSVPNPAGEDYICYQPRLQSPTGGKTSIRHRVKEWSDHVFFIGYDVFADEGKARGTGSRTIYAQEQPTHWAKTRRGERIPGPIPYAKGSAQLWIQLYGKDTSNASD